MLTQNFPLLRLHVFLSRVNFFWLTESKACAGKYPVRIVSIWWAVVKVGLLQHCYVVRVQHCYVVRVQHCYVVRVQHCYVVRVQQCYVVRVQHCYVVRVQQCYLVRVQKCSNANCINVVGICSPMMWVGLVLLLTCQVSSILSTVYSHNNCYFYPLHCVLSQ